MNVKEILLDAISLNLNGKHHQAKVKIEKILKKYPNNPDALRIMGEIFFSEKEFSKAIIFFEKSLEIFNNQPLLINTCAVCYLELNDYKNAINYFNLALSYNPNFEEALFNKALALEKSNKISDAINTFKTLKKINPSYIDAYYKLTSLFLLESNYSLAYKNLNDLQRNNPNSCDAIFYQERSYCCLHLKKLEEALSDINKSIELNPSLSESFNNRGNIYKELSKDDLAIKDFNEAIAINNNNSDAYANLAALLNKLKKFDDALLNYNKAIQINHTNYHFYINRSLLYKDMKLYEKAFDDLNIAIKISNPDEAYKAMADLHVSLGDYEAAIEDLTHAIQITPKPIYYTSRGLLYLGIDKFNECEMDYSKKINTNNDLTDIQKFDLSILFLHLGKFDIGWKYYHSRISRQAYKSIRFSSDKKKWSGEKDIGTIYVFNEQGVGDQLIFSTLLDELLATNNKIILSIDPRLVNIYKNSFVDKNIDIFPREILDHNSFVSPSLYDFYISICDLGGIFRNNINDFSKQPYKFLQSNINKSKEFKRRIGPIKKALCGISWLSRGAFGEFKNISLIDLLPILKIDELDFLNLQYGEVAEEIDSLQNNYGILVNNISDIDLFKDLDSLFSLVETCDFIVTTSNVTAHIAGSLGKETYLLSSFGPGKIWYWRLFNGKNLWYPSIKVFEQKKSRDWNSPVNEIAKILKDKYS